MIYAGLDVGTTNCKITIFEDYLQKDSFSLAYDSKRDETGHEIDANLVYETVLKLIGKAINKYPLLKAIGITSFGETFVLLDEDDNILFKSMLYSDPRGDKEAKLLEEIIGKERLGKITGQIGQGMFSLPKIMYIKNNYPNIFKKVNKILLMEDFVVYKLTNVRQIDYSLASRTLCFDVNKKCWSKEILDKVNIDANLFSKPVKTGTIASNIKDSLKEKLKFKNDVLIINIAHDQIANAIGANVYDYKSAVDGCGTCECITINFKDILKSNILYEDGYGIVPYVKENSNVCYCLITTGGALIKWVIDTYFNDLKDNPNIYDIFNKNVSEEVSNVLILPHFAGASTPYMDVFAKGSIINLTLATTRYEIYQASLESLCYEMKISLDILKSIGIEIDKLYVTGGGAINDTWLQMKADIFNINVYQLENLNSGTIGSAIVVGTTLKLFKDFKEGQEKLIKVKKVFTPNQSKHQKYLIKYEKYKKLYEILKEVR